MPLSIARMRGLIAHFHAIHDAVRISMILYDVPSRTACPLNDLSIKRLTSLPRIIGLKDATADVPRVARLRRRVGRQFLILSGDDATQSALRAATAASRSPAADRHLATMLERIMPAEQIEAARFAAANPLIASHAA